MLYPSPSERQLSNKSLWFLTLLPAPRFCLVRAVNLSKWCRVMPGLGNRGTFPPSIPCAGSTRQSHPRPALLLISKEQPEPREPDEGDIWPWSLCQVTAVL